MASRGSGRRTIVDLPTAWTKWAWQDDESTNGFWYSYRLGPNGEKQYEYLSSEQYQAAHNAEATPRFHGPSVLTSSAQYSPPASSTSPVHNTHLSGTSYTHEPLYTAYGGSASAASPRYEQLPSSTSTAPGESSKDSLPTPLYGSRIEATPSVSYSTTPYLSRPQYSLNDATHGMHHLSVGSPTSPPSTAPEGQQYTQQDYSNDPGPSTDALGEQELDSRYKTVETKNEKNFWKAGRVFLVLWTEPARDAKGVEQRKGDGKYSVATHTKLSRTYLGGTAFTEIRRYVVIQEGYGNSICCPIHSYGGQATLKENLPDATQHAIIYTSSRAPDEYYYDALDGTRVSEELSKDPIKVRREQKGPEGDLGTKSRINYSKLYTIEHYNKVLNIGMVEPDWLETLTNNSLVRRGSAPERPRHRPSRGSKKPARRDDEREKGRTKKSGKEPERSERRHRS